MKHEADARLIEQKQLLYGRLAIGNEGIEGEIFLEGHMPAIIRAAVAGFFLFPTAAACWLGE